MTVTTDHLAQFGITMEEAHDFIFSHLDDAQLILSVATRYGVTTPMLGEIAGGYSAVEVRDFFSQHGLDGAVLDDSGGNPGVYYDMARADSAALVGVAPAAGDESIT